MENLDFQNLIIHSLDHIANKLNGIESRLDNIESRLSNVESRLNNLEIRTEKLEKALIDFRHEQDVNFVKLENKISNQILSLDIKLSKRLSEKELKISVLTNYMHKEKSWKLKFLNNYRKDRRFLGLTDNRLAGLEKQYNAHVETMHKTPQFYQTSKIFA